MPRKLPKGRPPSQRGNRAVVEPRRDEIAEEDEMLTAVHEAGHAVAASVLCRTLVSVDIKRRPFGDRVSLGYTKAPTRVNVGDIEAARNGITQCMAGPIAEARYNDDVAHAGNDQNDRAQAFEIAACALIEPVKVDGKLQITSAMQEAHREAMVQMVQDGVFAADKFVTEWWDAIRVVAAELLRRRALSGADVASIVQANPPVPAEEN